MLSSTLNPIDGHCVGQHPLVRRLLQGCYNANPPSTKYTATWDPEVVFGFMVSAGTEDRWLGPKLATLLALATMLRTSELASISRTSVRFEEQFAGFTLLAPPPSQNAERGRSEDP